MLSPNFPTLLCDTHVVKITADELTLLLPTALSSESPPVVLLGLSDG